ncbi:MAG: nucleotidyltransferase [Methylocystaceae bacterium]
MSALAIICEYNPFHNGHQYQMDKAREITGVSPVICLMSGSMVQRGEPAVFDKWSRAAMALTCGADLVAELPVIYAASSARRFARGAVRLLTETNAVSHLAFGIEANDASTLLKLAELLSFPPSGWEKDIQTGLSHGLSYATARLQATLKMIEELGYDQHLSDCQQIMSSPNNILGLEYLIALNELGSTIIPVPITRQGQGYHSLEQHKFPSATLLRQLLSNGLVPDLASMVPQAVLGIINEQISKERGPVSPSSLDALLLYRLRSLPVAELEKLADIEPGMGSRIKQAADQAGNREQLRHNIKTKRYTMTRIDRILLYSLLDITKADVTFSDNNSPNYLRVLGCSSSGQKILQKMRLKSQLSLINRVRPAFKQMQQTVHPGLSSLLLDLKATDLQALLFNNPYERYAGQDFTRSQIIF